MCPTQPPHLALASTSSEIDVASRTNCCSKESERKKEKFYRRGNDEQEYYKQRSITILLPATRMTRQKEMSDEPTDVCIFKLVLK